MKISYLFPIIEKDFDIETFYKGLVDSNFYKKYESREVFFVVKKDNEKVLDFLNQIAIRNFDFKIITIEKEFDCQDAFTTALKYIDGDVLLFGDTKIKNNSKIFELLVKKNEEGADIVQVKKRGKKVKEFFKWCFEKIYNGLSIFLAGKKDSFNITSLGLYCRDVLDVLKAMQKKSSFLKNARMLNGFSTSFIFINDKIETYNLDYCKPSTNLIISLSGALLNFACFDFLILMLILQLQNAGLILGALILLLLGIIAFIIFGFKHMLDVRANNFESPKEISDIKNIDRIV